MPPKQAATLVVSSVSVSTSMNRIVYTTYRGCEDAVAGGGGYPGVLLLCLHGHEAKEDEGGGRQEEEAEEQVDNKLLHRDGQYMRHTATCQNIPAGGAGNQGRESPTSRD